MKNPSLLTVVISFIVTSSVAFAATETKKPVTAKAAKAKIAKVATKKVATKKAATTKTATKSATAKMASTKSATPSTNTTTTTTSAPALAPALALPQTSAATTLKTSVSEKAPAEKTSPWGFAYKSYNSLPMNTFENYNVSGDDREIQTWDRFVLSYKLNPNISVSLMPQVFHSWFGNPDRPQDTRYSQGQLTQRGAFYLGDTAVIVSDSQIAKLRGDWVVDGFMRYYFPTSEMSQKADTVGVWWSDIGIGRSYGPVDLHLYTYWEQYLQQYRTSSFFNNTGAPVPLYDYRWFTLLDTTVNFSKKLNFTWEMGWEAVHKWGDPNVNTTLVPPGPTPDNFSNRIIFNPDLNWVINKTFALDFGVWEETNMTNRATSYQIFNPNNDDVEGYLMATIKI